jgi:methylmalonyl-CoA/ethylmalonyl-CoA epimerase
LEKIGTTTIMQICLVVKDAEATMRNFMDLFGIEKGVLKQIPPAEKSKTYYHGKEITTSTKYYVFRMGDIVFELTQPDDSPSVWKEVLDQKGPGLCYLGVMVEDSTKVVDFLAQKGNPRIHHGGTPESNYSIVDTRESLGFLMNVKMQKQQ